MLITKKESDPMTTKEKLIRIAFIIYLVGVLVFTFVIHLTFNRYQLEMLFQIISERSERASVIINTNLEFSEWTQLFENEIMLSASNLNEGRLFI